MKTGSDAITAAQIRGTLPAASLDARAITRLAKNPGCQRLAAITQIGSSPGKAMQHVFAENYREEQSRFALAKGRVFERVQCENGAARLLASLSAAGILGTNDVSVRDINAETEYLKAPVAKQKRAIALTDQILRQKATGDPAAPAVVLQAALAIPLSSGEVACVRPDVLVARPDEEMFRPGELKSYAYLHHLTDQKDVAQAAGQMGVYGMALERRLAYLDLTRPVPHEGALVLVKPGGLQSVAQLQNISRDISTAHRIIEVRPRTLAELVATIGTGATLDTKAAIMSLSPCYSGKCRSFCALHDICRAEAAQHGNPAILGDEAEALLAAAGTNLMRVAELIHGAAPTSANEELLQRRLQTLELEWRQAS
jgi:hypothetical protein